jgi:hypothetical protein
MKRVSLIATYIGRIGFLVLSSFLIATCSAFAQEVGGRLSYSGKDAGVLVIKPIEMMCVSRSDHLVGFSYKPGFGKTMGPSLAFFSVRDSGIDQHMSFVPSGQSKENDGYVAFNSGKIPGLVVSGSDGGWVIRFNSVEMHRPISPSDKLTLTGEIRCQ